MSEFCFPFKCKYEKSKQSSWDINRLKWRYDNEGDHFQASHPVFSRGKKVAVSLFCLYSFQCFQRELQLLVLMENYNSHCHPASVFLYIWVVHIKAPNNCTMLFYHHSEPLARAVFCLKMEVNHSEFQEILDLSCFYFSNICGWRAMS